ncbi:putative defense protein 3 [Asterias amurensis]|uniref:putative defense protein 3 n=1 Tax=Asterias amurensis TaxID=7602 RepID=UPI003AB7C4F0
MSILVMLCVSSFLALAMMPGMHVMAYPSGPPVAVAGVCQNMDPTGHRPRTSSGRAPYTIRISSDTYGNKKSIDVTVQANRGYAFTGLFVQARRQATGRDITEALGEFTSVSSGTKFITCVTVASAWGHNSNAPKTAVTASWTPPFSNQGPIIFKATIVKGPASEFWTNVESPIIYFSNGKDEEPTTLSGTTSGRGCDVNSSALFPQCLSLSRTTFVLLAFTAILVAAWTTRHQ